MQGIRILLLNFIRPKRLAASFLTKLLSCGVLCNIPSLPKSYLSNRHRVDSVDSGFWISITLTPGIIQESSSLLFLIYIRDHFYCSPGGVKIVHEFQIHELNFALSPRPLSWTSTFRKNHTSPYMSPIQNCNVQCQLDYEVKTKFFASRQ